MRAKRKEILSVLNALLAEKLKLAWGGDSLDEEVGLLGQGIGLDSVEVLQLVIAIEEEYGLTLDGNELKPEHFRTVGSFVTFIQQRLS